MTDSGGCDPGLGEWASAFIKTTFRWDPRYAMILDGVGLSSVFIIGCIFVWQGFRYLGIIGLRLLQFIGCMALGGFLIMSVLYRLNMIPDIVIDDALLKWNLAQTYVLYRWNAAAIFRQQEDSGNSPSPTPDWTAPIGDTVGSEV